jgi:hypothetical protein
VSIKQIYHGVALNKFVPVKKTRTAFRQASAPHKKARRQAVSNKQMHHGVALKKFVPVKENADCL